MKKYYSLLPKDWDYESGHNSTIRELMDKGVITPCDIEYMEYACGALFHLSLKQIRNYTINLKEKWPFIKFAIYEGQTWGSMVLVEEF